MYYIMPVNRLSGPKSRENAKKENFNRLFTNSRWDSKRCPTCFIFYSPLQPVDALLVEAVLLLLLLGGMAHGEDGKGPLPFGDPHNLLHRFHALLHRGNAQPYAAQALGRGLQPEVLHGDGHVDLGVVRGPELLPVGGDDGHGRAPGAAGVGADAGERLQHIAVRHDIELPGLLVARRGRLHGRPEDRKQLLLLHRFVGKFPDADPGVDLIHGSTSFFFYCIREGVARQDAHLTSRTPDAKMKKKLCFGGDDMIAFGQFYLDREKDIAVELTMEGERLFHVIRTPNHHTGNLITNLARLCSLDTQEDESGLKVIRGEIPCYYDGDNRQMYILRLGSTKIANIYPDGRVELKASIPAISKTLMSQTKDYRLGLEKTIVKTYIRSDCKFHTDLHTHMNGILPPDVLIALGICHQIRYPYYYIKKLGLKCTPAQLEALEARRVEAERKLGDLKLTGKHRERRIDDYTFLNFAELILGNPEGAAWNLDRIRNSLTIPKDGQAVFADLEKVYLYRYVFTKAQKAEDPFSGISVEALPDREVRAYARQILLDRADDRYRANTLYQDLLLWIAREYRRHGISYVEITDTALLNRQDFPRRLREIHEILPTVTRETGVLLRFLAGIRRIPLTIVRDAVTPNDYLAENLRCLRTIAADPYVAGCDIVGEEINDILELKALIRELVRVAGENPGFVLRIHAGENDSLRDNVANAIRCVAEALAPGQPFPPLRLGHGLYTCDLNSPKGKKLLEEMRLCGVTLEFQLSSNVRLNNLSSLDRHPLRQYLNAGVSCVQGTDGCALYGTNSIDEELSLEKLLGLSHEELCRMRRAEAAIEAESLRIFREKERAFAAAFSGGDLERYYREKTAQAAPVGAELWRDSLKPEASQALSGQLAALPAGCFPIVVAGGSFNNSSHRTRLRPEDRELLERILDAAPANAVFVVGHTLCGQEGLLVKLARGRFPVFAIVPSRVSPAECARLREAEVGVLVSIESSGMGLYKSFAYEIFKRMPSALLAFDGNSAAMNLIQEARNGREKCSIFLNPRSRGLAVKARTLEGYIHPLEEAEGYLRSLAAERG